MKFVPVNMVSDRYSTPFCRTTGLGRHEITPQDLLRRCAECGLDDLVSATSDHMNTPKGPVLLCLPCAETYKIMHGLTKLVGA